MIVDSMTLEEIHKELHNDAGNTMKTVGHRAAAFRSVVLKSRTFPVIRHYECSTIGRKNRFFVKLMATKRGDYSNPYMESYCIYSRPEGLYCAILGHVEGFTVIMPPHFFSRYRERVVRDEQISGTDLIHLFMRRYWHFYFANFPTDGREVFDTIEDVLAAEKVDLIGICTDGLVFGERIGDINLIKTIIPGRMLLKNQYPLYYGLYLGFKHELQTSYPEKVVDYALSLPDDYDVNPNWDKVEEYVEQFFESREEKDYTILSLKKTFKGV